MTVACFTLARCGNDGAMRYWKQQVMKSDRPVCCLDSVQEGEARTLGTHPMQAVTRLAGGAFVPLWLSVIAEQTISAFSMILCLLFP